MRNYLTIPLSSQFDRADFSCGEAHLDHYLKKYAKQDLKRKEAAVFIYPKDNLIAGYYTLSALHIDATVLPKSLIKKLKLSSYPQKPATLLGRLAVDHRFQQTGIGKLLLIDALKRSYYQSTQIGSFALVVDTLNDHVTTFYQHFGFVPLLNQPNRLILPMKTISKLFEV